jgi:hypothetical protein
MGQTPEQHAAANRAWYLKNREAILARKSEYRQNNLEAVRERSRQANKRRTPAQLTASYRLYATRHPEKIREKKERHRNAVRDYMYSFKNVPCADCGIKYPPYVMQFDHVRGVKLFNIGSTGRGKSREALEEEIAKCEVVCANCHMERTHGSRKNQKPFDFSDPIGYYV